MTKKIFTLTPSTQLVNNGVLKRTAEMRLEVKSFQTESAAFINNNIKYLHK